MIYSFSSPLRYFSLQHILLFKPAYLYSLETRGRRASALVRQTTSKREHYNRCVLSPCDAYKFCQRNLLRFARSRKLFSNPDGVLEVAEMLLVPSRISGECFDIGP